MATGVTAEAIQNMIQDALATQAEVHRTELAALAAHLQNSPASAVRNTTASSSFLSTFIYSLHSKKNHSKHEFFTRLQRIGGYLYLSNLPGCRSSTHIGSSCFDLYPGRFL